MKRIYFLRPVGLPGPIKIGFSIAPESRLRTILAWSPIPLEIAAICPGDHETEVAIHHRFAHLALHGEWFGVDDDLLALIDAINAGKPLALEAIDNGSIPSRLVSAIKSSITRSVSDAEYRVYSHRLNHGTGRPEHIQNILSRFTGLGAYPPTPEEQQALAAYVTELRARPAFRGDHHARWKAWSEYRDGPNGFNCTPIFASAHAS